LIFGIDVPLFRSLFIVTINIIFGCECEAERRIHCLTGSHHLASPTKSINVALLDITVSLCFEGDNISLSNVQTKIMKFSVSVLLTFLLAENAKAFAPQLPLTAGRHQFTSSSARHMAADMPPPATSNNLPVIQQNSYGQPTDVRYSDFLKLVKADRLEKVTFSADGSQLLGVDVDGVRVKIEALPNDPSLLTELTGHKVRERL
jgi:hypothetical protein